MTVQSESPSNQTARTIRISTEKSDIDPTALVDLYASVGWMKQSEGIVEKTAVMLERVDGVVGAFDGDDRLVGFVKILSDGWLYTTVAEIIVHPDWQRRGVGRLRRVGEGVSGRGGDLEGVHLSPSPTPPLAPSPPSAARMGSEGHRIANPIPACNESGVCEERK